MPISFPQVIISLLAGIVAIIILTVRFRVHPFFALLIACFITGLGIQLGVPEILNLIKAGFGDIMSKLAIIIVLGTTIGVLLEKNGSTQVMASFILKLVGEKRSSLAIAITGFVVGLPIFCDSGYIVLNGINKSLVKKTGIAVAAMSVSLGSGLYAVHCLLPPHPGATAAASTLSVDFGKLILYGIIIAIPAMLVGHAWAVFSGKKSGNIAPSTSVEESANPAHKPGAFRSFLPIIVPILLMAVKSMIGLEHAEGWLARIFNVAGDPSIALATGVLLAIAITKSDRHTLSTNLSASVEKAGGILVIIGAGGAFGAVLSATNIGTHFSDTLDMKSMGIWFPFLLTFIIKTAQGSSTVAIVTASSIILPLLPALGLDSENGKILAVLAMGAGSMMISHTNDAYFWVISRFSDIDIKTMLRTHSLASLWMGLITMIIIYILSFLMK